MQPTYQLASISAGISTAVRYKATVTARPGFCCKRLGQYWVLNWRHGGFQPNAGEYALDGLKITQNHG